MNWQGMIAMAVGLLFGTLVLKRLVPYGYGFGLRLLFWFRYGKKGRNILFVYSASAVWKDYLETNLLPRIGEQAVLLNLSNRSEREHNPFLVRVFQQWSGPGDFTPTGIIVPLTGKVRVLRLWQPGRGLKPGKAKPDREAVRALLAAAERGLPS